jgi:hypothetical protein
MPEIPLSPALPEDIREDLRVAAAILEGEHLVRRIDAIVSELRRRMPDLEDFNLEFGTFAICVGDPIRAEERNFSVA